MGAPRSSAPPARITLLPEEVKNQIAAGEVVERPASVVKELVENALDAGAGEVRVDLEEGGTRLVRVTDDGSGMGPADLELAFRPHATSKLRVLADLEHIGSLGFRGEALASIGSVSRARILSRPAGSEGGWEVLDEGGAVSAVREAGAPRGTTVEIRDLFHNTPARRRFLKGVRTELGRSLDVLQRLAIAHGAVGFVVTHDQKRVLDVPRELGPRERVRRLFGAELADGLVEVADRDGDTELSGLLAPPRFARRDASRQMWFLNGRPLRDKLLTRILREAYRGLLVDPTRQPVAFLHVAMDPGDVDVNVHPTKAEVRFREERRVFGFLVEALRRALARADLATPGGRLVDLAARRHPAPAAPRQAVLPDPGALPGPRSPAGDEPLRVYEVPAGRSAAPAPPSGRHREGAAAWDERPFDGEYLQVARTYLVRALPDGFEVLDQHALHERVTFEALRAQVRSGRVEVQRRLIPELVELGRDELALIEEHRDALARIGIELEVFGRTTVAVQGLPGLFARPDPEAIVREVVDVLARTGEPPTADLVLEDVLHRAACRSSVMAGDELADTEIRALLARAADLESDQTCPHGRPTRVRFTLADLERAFQRR